MDRLIFKIISIFILVISPECILAQGTWQPPEAPDQLKGAPSEYLNRAVLRIKSTWTDLGAVINEQSGAGIALGVRRGRLYVMTAAHVVRSKIHGSANDIKVILKRAPPREYYSAELVDYEAKKDFAVLVTQPILNELDRESVVKFAVEYGYTYGAGKNIKVIGHPKDDLWRIITTKTKQSNDPSFMRLKRSSIDYGNSGGPVLSDSHRLIGMVTSVKGADAYALKITDIVKVLEAWDIPYRSRLVADYSNNFSILVKAVYSKKKGSVERLYGKLYEEKYFAKLYRPQVALFNKNLAVLVHEQGKNANRQYYVELVGDYYSDNADALDEAWRILVRSISKFVPKGYAVRQQGYTIDFSKFKKWKGRMHIRVVEERGTLFVVIGKNMDKNVITLGESISALDSQVSRFLHKKWKIENQ